MFLWRISNHTTLDGRGGLSASARWHTEGRPIVYLAETPAGSLVEALVHLELPRTSLPKVYKLLKAEAPEDLSIRTIDGSGLQGNWLEDQIVTRTVGDEWLASRNTALLRVPSAIVPETFNTLLNPEHPDATRVQVLWHEQYPWDKRLVQRVR
jgi:RES domain-containing protein